jgi:hypothetical protein
MAACCTFASGTPRLIMAVCRRNRDLPVRLTMETHQITAETMCRSRLNRAPATSTIAPPGIGCGPGSCLNCPRDRDFSCPDCRRAAAAASPHDGSDGAARSLRSR